MASEAGHAFGLGDGSDPAQINAFLNKGFGEALGLEFTELTPDRVRAQWKVTPALHQPWGIMHGGVHCAVVESVASIAASIWLGDRGHVVGVNNNTDFLRASREGVLYAEGNPVHRGRTQQLWLVTITDEQERLVARGQVRLQNITETDRLGK
ncbi:PaaI family thioesterase [Rhodococcus sp. ABRD24]|uniref:PaaI family thioesterase n=1 Tax=Rhodococcus sp. ABRD24 TaxID=2507582 RepID=UPI00103D2718|nr:PaaI family thioesterase [Rhodococcus sp. ABRD24]QBJ98465.1 PaaI family thioesterase [Rhodococcus sp. ABRD24]